MKAKTRQKPKRKTKKTKIEQGLDFGIFFDLLADAYFVCDSTGGILYANKVSAKITGVPIAEMSGKPFSGFNLSPSWSLKYNTLPANPIPVEYTLTQPDGNQLILEITCNPFKMDNMALVLIIAKNVTLYKKEEKKLRDYHQSIKTIYGKILAAEEDEKRRISRDLHDETGQIIIALGASLNVIEKELKEGNIEHVLVLIGEKRKLVQQIAGSMKSMARNLRPPALDILGLSAVLREYFSQFTNSEPIRIEFTENLKDVKMEEHVEITLYRIVQETIFNILKHSNAIAVKVNLLLDKQNLTMRIEDNGKGFNIEEYHTNFDPTKMGLRGIKERVDALKGSLNIESSPGKGTKVIVCLPLSGGQV